VQSYDKCRTRCIPRFFLFSTSFSFVLFEKPLPHLSLPITTGYSAVSQRRACFALTEIEFVHVTLNGAASRYHRHRRAHIFHVILSRSTRNSESGKVKQSKIERKGKEDCLTCARAYRRMSGTHVYFVQFHSIRIVHKLLFDRVYLE